MKPSKSRIYCRDCGRMKTVFDSEEAAMRFIQYNKRDIIENSGYAPTRAYYCDLCCAWHVTSKTGYSNKSFARRTLESILEINQKMTKTKAKDSNKPIKQSESPAAPFLTVAYEMVKSIFSFARDDEINQAKEQCANLDLLFEKMTLVKGANNTRDFFCGNYEKLRELIFQDGTINSESLDLIEQKFNDLYLMNPSIFCYDANAPGAITFDLTPDNIDEVYYAGQNKEKAKVNFIKNINALLMSASASIACGDFSDAKKDLIEASELIENLDDQESIKEYSKEIVKLIDIIESESED